MNKTLLKDARHVKQQTGLTSWLTVCVVSVEKVRNCSTAYQIHNEEQTFHFKREPFLQTASAKMVNEQTITFSCTSYKKRKHLQLP